MVCPTTVWHTVLPTKNPTASPTTVLPIISLLAPPPSALTSSEDAVNKPAIVIYDINDNNDENLVFQTICDEDIVILKQVGTTNILLQKNKAILIISQDCSVVRVQLQQTWDSPHPPRLLKNYYTVGVLTTTSLLIDYMYIFSSQ